MNPLEAPHPAYLVRETEVVRNSLAEGLPLPQGDTLEVGTKTYQAVRLPAPEGTYLLLLEVSHLAVRAKAYQSLLRVLKGLMQHEEPEGLLKDLIREAVAVVP